VREPQSRPATANEIEADWREFTGGPPVVGVLREYEAADVEGIVWRDEASERSGVVTWWTAGAQAASPFTRNRRAAAPALASWTLPRKRCAAGE
jgi:hypothetical protein